MIPDNQLRRSGEYEVMELERGPLPNDRLALFDELKKKYPDRPVLSIEYTATEYVLKEGTYSFGMNYPYGRLHLSSKDHAANIEAGKERAKEYKSLGAANINLKSQDRSEINY